MYEVLVSSVIHVAGTHHTQSPLNQSVMASVPASEFNFTACPLNRAYWEPLVEAEDWTWALQVASQLG